MSIIKELTLKEIQEGSYKVLCKIKEICDNNEIHYFLFYGTLLGAIRHDGFIPWDDDIDVIMPRPDYEKFIQFCKNHSKELGNFKLLHYSTSKKYIYPIARFIDSNYTIQYNDAKDYGLGLFVDIYPIDGRNPHDITFEKDLKLKIKWINLCGSKKFIPSKKWYKNLRKFPAFLISRFLNLNKLIKKIDQKAQKYPFDTSSIVDCMAWDFGSFIFKKEWLNISTTHLFCSDYFCVPKDYSLILSQNYGDYMQLPPLEERIGHHFYSAYKKN
jgi:lipopolysaccharide cholinephosphotransferase